VYDLREGGVQKGNSSRDVLSRGNYDSKALSITSAAGAESTLARQENREPMGTADMVNTWKRDVRIARPLNLSAFDRAIVEKTYRRMPIRNTR
jgi:hypothetical protein